ncbi:MAG: protein phosphatase 2C domain-containing protein [Candidatus Latescibacterota bacterium]
MAGAGTDRGQRRESNEDTFALSSSEPPILVVADGLGGRLAGEIASRLATEQVLASLEQAPGLSTGSDGHLGQVLAASLQAAHAAVLAAAARHPEWQGMATALVVACVLGDRLHTCHVGDVRAYLIRSGAAAQLTQDHSLAAEQARAGTLTPVQARVHHSRHRLSQALGVPPTVAPESHAASLLSGDLVLLCSDGLWEAVADEALARISGMSGTPLARVGRLVAAANQDGGRDNITAVLYEHQPEHR